MMKCQVLKIKVLDNNKSKKKKRKVNNYKFIKAFHDEHMTLEAGGDRHGP